MFECPGDQEPLGVWLRLRRQAAGLTQEELAERAGLSRRTISSLECDRTRTPYPRSVRLVTRALGVTDTVGNELIARYRAARSGLWRPPDGNGAKRSRPGVPESIFGLNLHRRPPHSAQMISVHVSTAGNAGDGSSPARPRPYWQGAPCPAWCTEPHFDGQQGSEREHAGEPQAIKLALEEPKLGEAFCPATLSTSLAQGYREAEARINSVLQTGHRGGTTTTMAMTLAEAEQYAAILLELVQRARAGGS